MFENDTEILGIKGMPSENLHAGVGYVIIPKNVDIDVYKEDVYRSGRISIFGGYGHSNFYNILIDREALQRISFPDEVGKMGTPVVWINIPKHNEPVIVAVLKYDEDFHSLSEARHRITRQYQGNIVDLDLDGKKGKVRLNVYGNNTTKSEIDITLGGVNNDSLFKLKVNGKIWVRSSDDFIQASEKRVAKVVTNKSGVVKAKLELKSEGQERLLYVDEHQNEISATDEHLNIRADKSKRIDFGNGSEKAVLGNTLLDIMDRYDTANSRMTFQTPMGPTSTRINETEFQAIRQDFEKILSKLVNLD